MKFIIIISTTLLKLSFPQTKIESKHIRVNKLFRIFHIVKHKVNKKLTLIRKLSFKKPSPEALEQIDDVK